MITSASHAGQRQALILSFPEIVQRNSIVPGCAKIASLDLKCRHILLWKGQHKNRQEGVSIVQEHGVQLLVEGQFLFLKLSLVKIFFLMARRLKILSYNAVKAFQV